MFQLKVKFISEKLFSSKTRKRLFSVLRYVRKLVQKNGEWEKLLLIGHKQKTNKNSFLILNVYFNIILILFLKI